MLTRTEPFAGFRPARANNHTPSVAYFRWLPFAEGNHSGFNAPVIHREWFSVRPSPVINFVGDQQNIMVSANSATRWT